MKPLLLATFLGVLTLGASAQTEPDNAVHIHGYQIDLPAKPIHLFPGDFDVYKGTYELSNGETMVLRSHGRKIFADIGNRPRTEMVAAASNVFVAVDRQFQMTLSAPEFGDVTGELLLVVPSRTAQADGSGSEVVRLLSSR